MKLGDRRVPKAMELHEISQGTPWRTMEREGSSPWSQQPITGQLALIYKPEEYSQLDLKPLKDQTLSSLCCLRLCLASVRSLQAIQPKSVRISHLVAGQHMARRTNCGVLSFNI